MKTTKATRTAVRVAFGAGALLASAALILAIRDALHCPPPAVGVPLDAARWKGGA